MAKKSKYKKITPPIAAAGLLGTDLVDLQIICRYWPYLQMKCVSADKMPYLQIHPGFVTTQRAYKRFWVLGQEINLQCDVQQNLVTERMGRIVELYIDQHWNSRFCDTFEGFSGTMGIVALALFQLCPILLFPRCSFLRSFSASRATALPRHGPLQGELARLAFRGYARFRLLYNQFFPLNSFKFIASSAFVSRKQYLRKRRQIQRQNVIPVSSHLKPHHLAATRSRWRPLPSSTSPRWLWRRWRPLLLSWSRWTVSPPEPESND